MKTNYKRIPFDLDKAKRITKGEMKGRIVTEDGLTARIVCFDLKYGGSKILAALVDCGDYEIGLRCDLDGTCRDTRTKDKFNLHIEVPNNENRLSNKNKQMTRTTYKRIPFDLELAKKIMNKETKGRIVTREGRQVRIICFDRRGRCGTIAQDCLAALVEDKDGQEYPFIFSVHGMYSLNKEPGLDLLIEVPTYYRDYSNFKPCKWQPCLVRDTSTDLWEVGVCRGTDSNRVPIFYSANNSDGCCHWGHLLPLSKVTERLFGTYKSYEELIQELDNEQGKD